MKLHKKSIFNISVFSLGFMCLMIIHIETWTLWIIESIQGLNCRFDRTSQQKLGTYLEKRAMQISESWH